MDADELALLDATISRVVGAADGHDLTGALDGFGWLELLEADPGAAVPLVFAAQGRSVRWSSALHDVLSAGLAEFGDLPPQVTSVVVPLPLSDVAGRHGSDGLVIDGFLFGARPTAEWLVTATDDGRGQVTVSGSPIQLATLTPVRGLDPDVGVQRVSAVVRDGRTIAEGDAAQAWWTTSVASARRALTHQMCGGLATMIELARTHATERRQFGRPIGSFQAVRHKLAEAHVALAGATAVADGVWESDDQWLASMTAKLVCSRACRVIVRHSQQVLAGVGFTAEHPYHGAMKRALVIDRILGDADELAPLVGRELMKRGDAPRLVDL
jgi:Acyl-CoA dehydrogenase, C-terminal domain